MGSFLGDGVGPVTLGGAGVGVPPANFEKQAQAITKGQKEGGFFQWLWQFFWQSVWPGWMVVFRALVSGADMMIALFVEFYGLFQGAGVPGFYTLVGSILGDLLGVPVDVSVGGVGSRGASNFGGNLAIGKAFYGVLNSLIAPGGEVNASQGIEGAQAFLGFLIGFAVRQGNMEFLSSLIPEEWRFGEGVKGYGENVQRALGLGRMARLAFAPLINILIADPLKWALNAQYRPTLPGPGELVKATLRGVSTQPDARTALAWHGYNDANIEALIQETVERPSAADWYRLYAAGEIERDAAQQQIQNRGTTPELASIMLQVADLASADTWVEDKAKYLADAAKTRFIDVAKLSSELDGLPISDARKDAIRAAVSIHSEVLSKRPTLGQMQSGLVEGLIDLTEFEQFLIDEGYTPDAVTLITMLELVKLKTHSAEVAVAQYKYDKAVATAKAKNQPIPPPPAILTGTSGPIVPIP